MSTYDAVIVGARPAGAATAMLLARAGMKVLVVDRSAYGADTLSTHGLMRGGVLQLARWGLLDEVIARGTPGVRSVAFHYGNERVDVAIKPGHGVDALYAPRRTVLDPILVDAARDAGADVRFGVTVLDLAHDAAGRVTGVVGRDAQGALFHADANLTVGADGAASTIARLADAPVERVASSAAAFMYGYWDGLASGEYELFYRPGVTAGWFPTNDRQTCVFVGTTPARFRSEVHAGARRAYLRFLDDAACRVDGSPPDRLRVFAGRRGFIRRPFGPGWALVGDAGYFKDPITSHGITDALRDAELLARAVVADDLADYQATRDRLSERLFTVTDAIASFAWSLDEVAVLLRQLSAAMADEVRWLSDLDAVGTAA